MNRNRDYYRHHRERIINKKKKVVKEVYGFEYYKHSGKYDKNKIHCSCFLCAGKTGIHGKTISDMRKDEACREQEQQALET